MVLDDEQNSLFFDVMDALLYYVNDRFQVVEGFSLDYSSPLNDVKTSLVAHALWDNVEIIDDFVRDNPYHLGRRCLDIARSWKSALPGFYTLVRYQSGRALLMSEAGVFSVCGVTYELEGEIGPAPAYVETALLPFEGLIVYDGFLQAYDADNMSADVQRIQDEFENRCAKGIALTGADFIKYADSFLAEKRDREFDELLASVSRDADQADGDAPAEGFHIGALSGLSLGERREAVGQRLADKSPSDKVYNKELRRRIRKREPVTSLRACLMLMTKADLAVIARILGMGGLSKLRKAEMVDELVAELPTATEPFIARMLLVGDEEYELISAIAREMRQPDASALASSKPVDANVVLGSEANKSVSRNSEDENYDVCADTIEAERQAVYERCFSIAEKKMLAPMWPIEPYLFFFLTPRGYMAVVPDEVRALVAGADFRDIDRMRRQQKQALACIDACVLLHGVVSIDDAYDQYRALVSDVLTRQDFEYLIESEIRQDIPAFGLWTYLPLDYIVHYTLTPEFAAREFARAQRGAFGELMRHRETGELSAVPFQQLVGMARSDLAGELERLEQYKRDLVESQSNLPIKPLSRSLLENDVLDELLDNENVVRLRTFLDAHIPDGEDDYLFADEVAMDLVLLSVESGSIQEVFSYVMSLGLDKCCSDEGRVTLLVTNVFNSMPSWENNGWSPQELYEQVTGRKVFYNEDGTVMKVGGDDLCPCGSGKKYRECCGK